MLVWLVIVGISQAKTVPEDQENSGGQLHTVSLPVGFEIYSNMPQQDFLFLVDFDEKGNVVKVELRSGSIIHSSRNAKLLSSAILNWKMTPYKTNGKGREKWGGYFTFKVGGKKKAEAKRVRITSVGADIRMDLPDPVKRTLSEEGLKKIRKKESKKATSKKKESDVDSLFPDSSGL